MKVLMLNGSPRKEGCTYTALCQIAETLKENGIESEIFQAGNADIENVRAAAKKMTEADALIVGSPVYWASPTGQIIEFMDKFCSFAGKDMLMKPAAAIASARRAGTTATLDVLLKYFSFHQMPIVSSNYWNMVHATHRTKSSRTKKDSRSCTSSARTWHGFFTVWKPEKMPEFQNRKPKRR